MKFLYADCFVVASLDSITYNKLDYDYKIKYFSQSTTLSMASSLSARSNNLHREWTYILYLLIN